MLFRSIKAAKHELLLFTEAHCMPQSKRWIQSVAEAYQPDTEIVLGYCRYPETSGLLHKLAAYDLLTGGLRYLSSALAHHPFTGDGKNLSYRKPLFFAQKGYSRSLNLHAGADDLFINAVANGRNTQTLFGADSLITRDKLEDWSYYKELKIARAATQPYYKKGRLNLLRFEQLFFLLFFASSIALIITGIISNWILSILGALFLLIRCISKSVVLHHSARLFDQKPLTGWIWLLEWILAGYNLYIRIYRLFKGKNDYTARI